MRVEIHRKCILMKITALVIPLNEYPGKNFTKVYESQRRIQINISRFVREQVYQFKALKGTH